MPGILAYDPDQEDPKQIQVSEVYQEQVRFMNDEVKYVAAFS